jgi:hypothetical protein
MFTTFKRAIINPAPLPGFIFYPATIYTIAAFFFLTRHKKYYAGYTSHYQQRNTIYLITYSLINYLPSAQQLLFILSCGIFLTNTPNGILLLTESIDSSISFAVINIACKVIHINSDWHGTCDFFTAFNFFRSSLHPIIFLTCRED